MEGVCVEQGDGNKSISTSNQLEALPWSPKPCLFSIKRSFSFKSSKENFELRLHGPIHSGAEVKLETPPDECITEMKMRDHSKLTVNLHSSTEADVLFPFQNYNSLRRLLRVKA